MGLDKTPCLRKVLWPRLPAQDELEGPRQAGVPARGNLGSQARPEALGLVTDEG